MECSICSNPLSEEGELPSNSRVPAPPPQKRTRLSAAGTTGQNLPQLSSPTCGHTFHRRCLLEWLERGNKSCPICRQPTNTRQIKSVYLSISSSSPPSASPSTSAQSSFLSGGSGGCCVCPNCEIQKMRIATLERDLKLANDTILKEREKIRTIETRLNSVETRIGSMETELAALKQEVSTAIKTLEKKVADLEKELEEARKGSSGGFTRFLGLGK